MNLHLNTNQIDELLRMMADDKSKEDGNRDYFGDAQRHLEDCGECQTRMRAHEQVIARLASLKSNMPGVKGPMCPPEDVWVDVAAGIFRQDSRNLRSHAAQCDHCGPLLREAYADFADDPNSEEEVAVKGLDSSTPEWQKRLAERVSLAAGASKADGRTKWRWPIRGWSPIVRGVSQSDGTPFLERLGIRPSWVFAFGAAIAAAALGFSGISLWRAANPSEAHLLALAFNQQRTTVLRIDGGNPVPLASATRGAKTGLRQPVPLLELRLRAQKHLEQTPSSAYWHQILGEVELLAGNAQESRSDLEIAQAGNNLLPNLRSDLAAAWFEIGEQSGSAEAYAEAAELYSEELRASPRNLSLLYYNRALTWERQGIRAKALDDLHAALASEKSPEWRKAIEAEIARVSQGVFLHQRPAGGDAARPAQRLFTASQREGDNYEALLAEATEQLLPRWRAEPTVRTRLSQIAQIGIHHRDHWLHDWIEAQQQSASEKGDRNLVAAVRAGSAGDNGVSLAQSHNAVADYTAVGNTPGRLRGLLAETYALQRLDRARECLSVAQVLERDPHVKDYAWVRTQLTLEKAICSFLKGDFASASHKYDEAADESESYGLDWLGLRALAGQAEILDFRGSPTQAWQVDTTALLHCVQIRCPPIREYSFIYDLVQAAQALDLRYVALELARTNVPIAAASGDATTYAYALEGLATIAGRLGDYALSDQAFAEAWKITNSGKQIPSIELYRAEWQTDRAEILSRRGESRAALELLEQNQQALVASDYQFGRLHFFTDLVGAQLASGDFVQARSNALAAVNEAEHTLRSFHSIVEREQWQRENAPEYTKVVKAYLELKDSAKALNAWERYRYVAYQSTGKPSATPSPTAQFTSDAGSTPSDQQILVLALVDEGYVGWLVAPKGMRIIRTVNLGNRDRVHLLVTTFYHLCSDRGSSVVEIREVGGRLYAALLQPFADLMTSSQTLWLEMDPSLNSIPVSALTLPDGRWLGAAYEVKLLPAWWAIRPEILRPESALPLTSRVVLVNGFGRAQDSHSEASGIVALFPDVILVDGLQAIPRRILSDLKSAEIFHFSGHATAENGSNHLLLFSPNGLQSALGAELLTTLKLPRCKMAVLAACNTTSSNPDRMEAPVDLRNALLVAGVHAVIASNWDVDDRSTDFLMLTFYRKITQGISPTQSLRLAQNTVRLEKEWQHPYYWASFQFFAN